MQDMTPEICNSVSAIDIPEPLIDIRDNKTYQVTKLKMTPDGSQATCWMTQNLALNLSTTTPLTNGNTDLNSVASWTPIRNTIATGNLSTSTWVNDNNTPSSYNSGRIDYGVYYNWSAAVASNNTSTLTTAHTNAPDSICPKGWRLPQIYGGTSTNRPNEWGNLLYAYGLINNVFSGDVQTIGWVSNGYAEIQQIPFNFTLGGAIYQYGNFGSVGGIGFYRSTEAYSSTLAYYTVIAQDSFEQDKDGARGIGMSVRCILR